MTTNRSPRRLAAIILIYLLLATGYSIVTPIGRGADEWAHYWYAQFIADNGRLPQTVVEREAAGYKSDWPPLYHLAAAAVTCWIETERPPTFKYRADSLRRQLVPAQGPEAIVHTEDELFPWQQEILVWHLGRFLSIAFSAGTLLVTYLIALEVFSGYRLQVAGYKGQSRRGAGSQGGRSDSQTAIRNWQFSTKFPPGAIYNSQLLALAAVAVLAFNPRFLFTGMLFNYDSLTLLLSALFVWLSLRVARGLHPRWGFWGLGALTGLALVTKYLTLLLPLVIVVVAWVRWTKSQSRRVSGTQSRSDAEASHSQFIIRALAQAAIAYLLVIAPWFIYLIINFNEIDRYGPVLGTLAPLIRGDGSDRTVEALFAWLSGGQAPAPAYIEQQSYSAWQIIGSFFTTFWGNPIAQPYPLTWFIVTMVGVMVLALIGLVFHLRATAVVNGKGKGGTPPNTPRPTGGSQFTIRNSQFAILLLTCLLPLPFMLARLFGARDALEAVQGRHILFLAGPAFATLLVFGLSVVVGQLSLVTGQWRSRKSHSQFIIHNSQFTIRIAFYALFALLLTGSISQLLFMAMAYPPPAPVRTITSLPLSFIPYPSSFTLPGGAELVAHSLLPTPNALQVDLLWRGGAEFAPEDYQLELALVDANGGAVSGWRGYQTQARYPTRVWEPGDVVRDSGWLPLTGLPADDYTVQWRLLGSDDRPLVEWQTVGNWSLVTGQLSLDEPVTLWHNGQPASQPPTFAERETVQFTIDNSQLTIHNLTGPAGNTYQPDAAGPGWANYIIQPHWPAGDYRLEPGGEVILRVAPSARNFETPAEMAAPLQASFEDEIKLLGYTLLARRVQPGEGLPITLYWQAQAWLGEEFVIFTRLLDNQGFAWGGYDRLAQENYSTLLWAPGEIITDGFAVPVAPDAPDGVYWLSVGWYRQADDEAESLQIFNPETGEPTGDTAVMIGPVKVGGPPSGAVVESAQPESDVNVSLGEQIELLGYDWRMDEPTNSLKLTFYWQALRQPDADYTVFIHIRDTAGNVIAQKDQPPLNGAYPTSLWDAGEIIKDEMTVPLEGLPPGEYEVITGLYDFETGVRLAVGEERDDVINLGYLR